MFITFEGLDSSGKTTQAQFLVDDCRNAGKKVVFLREPGGTSISERIRDILLDKNNSKLSHRAELLLFSAARAQLVDQVISPAVAAGKIVVCDRFYDSTTAYQGYGRGLDIADVRAINRIATSGTTPYLTFFVDVSWEEIVRRRRAAGIVDDRMESSGKEFYEHVRQGYREIAGLEPLRIMTINGMRGVNEIHDEIWSIVKPFVSKSRST